MKILHIAFSGLGGHGNVFFSMVDADTEKKINTKLYFLVLKKYGKDTKKKQLKEMCPGIL